MGGARFFRPATPRFFHGGTFRFWSFSRVETSGGIRASLAGRYASALFDLARDQRRIEAVGKSLDALGQALLDSKDFAELVESPLVSRDEAGKKWVILALNFSADRPFDASIRLDGCAAPESVKALVYTGAPTGLTPGDARIEGTTIRSQLPPYSITVFEANMP